MKRPKVSKCRYVGYFCFLKSSSVCRIFPIALFSYKNKQYQPTSPLSHLLCMPMFHKPKHFTSASVFLLNQLRPLASSSVFSTFSMPLENVAFTRTCTPSGALMSERWSVAARYLVGGKQKVKHTALCSWEL